MKACESIYYYSCSVEQFVCACACVDTPTTMIPKKYDDDNDNDNDDDDYDDNNDDLLFSVYLYTHLIPLQY